MVHAHVALQTTLAAIDTTIADVLVNNALYPNRAADVIEYLGAFANQTTTVDCTGAITPIDATLAAGLSGPDPPKKE